MHASQDLGSRPSGRITTRVVVGSAAVAALTTAAAWATAPVLPQPTDLLAILMTTAASAATFAALLLHLLTAARGRGHERWAATGLAVTAVAMWMQVIGFPTIDLDGGPFGTTNSGAASLYFVWHTALPLFIVAGCTGFESSRLSRRVAAGVALASATWLAIGSLPGPTWFAADMSYLPASYAMMWFDVALTVMALALWMRRTGPHPRWTEAAVTTALVFTGWDVLLRTFGTTRFTPWWWASLAMRVASVVVPMLWLGLGAAALQRRLDSYTDQLERSYDDQVDSNRALADHADDLDAFARTVAHDLRSPLTASMGLVETVLRHHELPDQARHMLDRALHRQRDQAAMLDGLLRLARAGDGALSLEPIALSTALNAVLERTGVEVTVDLVDDVTVHADPAALLAIVQNLLTNAVTYGSVGGSAVVRLSTTERADGRVDVLVDDHGPGIPAQLRDRVFVAFDRGDAAGDSGTGLGLAIVQRLVERHHGTIAVEEAPGGGARFRFDLPLVPASARPATV